jgi:hypothetical protein
LEEVIVRAARKVLMEVDDNTLLIGGYPHGILDQQFMPHNLRSLNINNIIIINYIIFMLF